MGDKLVSGSLAQFLCPICLEVPTGKIFQCKNGHIMCSSCSKKMTKCEKCFFASGSAYLLNYELVRNRALENILKNLLFPCSIGDCKEVARRKGLKRHKEICAYRGVNVCPQLGYDCKHTAFSSADFRKHLKSLHGATLHSTDGFCSRTWKNFLLNNVRNKWSHRWTDVFSWGCMDFLMNVQLTFKHGSSGVMSLAVLCVSDYAALATVGTEFRATVRLSTVYKSTTALESTWMVAPVHFKCLDDNSGPCASIPVSVLQSWVESRITDEDDDDDFDFELILDVSVEKWPVPAPSEPAKRVKRSRSYSSLDD